MSKIPVGIVFGGRSGEHEVSLMSARSVMDALDKDRYDIVPIGITREGRWLTTFAGLAVLSLMLGLNSIGDGRRDAFDPRLRGA